MARLSSPVSETPVLQEDTLSLLVRLTLVTMKNRELTPWDPQMSMPSSLESRL